MSKWEPGTMTAAGLDLLARAEAGERMQITRVALGDGTLGSADPVALTALVNQVHTVPVLEINRVGTGGVHVRADVAQAALPFDFWWREVGVFAAGETGPEILYAYNSVDGNASYLGPGGQNMILITMPIFIGTAADVIIVVDHSMVYLTNTEFEKRFTESVSNSLSETEEGKALDARQGAVLVQMIDGVKARVVAVKLTAGGWLGSAAPYTQTVAAPGVTTADKLLLPAPTLESHEAYSNATILMRNITANGSVTFQAKKRPTVDVDVNIARWPLGE